MKTEKSKDDPQSLPERLSKFAQDLYSASPTPHEFEPPAPPSFTTEQTALFESFGKTDLCYKMRPEMLEISILAFLKKISDLVRKDMPEGIIRTYMKELERDIHNRLQWIRLGELKYALEQGAKGVFGEVYQLSYNTIYNWILEYRDSPERKAWVEFNKAKAQATQAALPAPVQTREQFLLEQTRTAWAIYTKTKNRNDVFMLLPVEAFEYLESTKLYVMAKEQKIHVRETVIAYMKARVKQSISPSAEMLKEFPFVIDGEEDKARLQTLCRKWVVAIYFQSLVNAKQTFNL